MNKIININQQQLVLQNFISSQSIVKQMNGQLSHVKSYKSKTQPNQQNESPKKYISEPYINPVIKNTLESLPLIYGANSNRKRKYKIFPNSKYDFASVLSRSHANSVYQNQRLNQKLSQNENDRHRGHSCLQVNKSKQLYIDRQDATKTVAKVNRKFSKSPDDLSNQQSSKSQVSSTPKNKRPVNLQAMHNLSKPRQHCNKQYCSCKSLYEEYKQEIKKKMKQKNNKNSGRKQNLSRIQLPRLSVELNLRSPPKLDDQESKHKVGFNYKFNSFQQQQKQSQFQENNSSCCVMCNKEKILPDKLELKGILGLIKKKQLQEKKKKLLIESQTQTIGIQSDFQPLSQSNVKNEDFGIQADLITTKNKLSTINQEMNTDLEDQQKDFKYLQNNKSLKSSATKQKKQPLQHLSHLKQQYKYKKRPTYESRYDQNSDQQNSDQENQECNHQNSYKNSHKNKRKSQLKRSHKKSQEQEEQFDIDIKSQSGISQKSLINHLAKALLNHGQDKSTIFKKLKKIEQQSEAESVNGASKKNKKQQKKKRNKMNLIDQNTGLFAIPQEQQYVDYLKSYQPISKDFKIKNLIKSQNFKILKYNDTLYFGQTDAQNRKHGQALSITSKQIFEGVYQNGIKMSGCQRNIDGVYIGEFLNGQRHGQGKWLWNNGEVYEGEWKLGTKSGHGIWKSPKGDSYEGQWLLNRQQGKGIHKHKSSTYEGQFVQSLKQGTGRQKFVNGDEYIGEYLRGKPHGKGKYIWKNGQYYEGQFKSGLRDGFGRWSFSPKSFYEGQFKGDFKHGYGKQVLENGDQYLGEYYEGVRSLGTFTQGATGKKVQIRNQQILDKYPKDTKKPSTNKIKIKMLESNLQQNTSQMKNQQQQQKQLNNQSLIHEFLKNTEVKKKDRSSESPKNNKIQTLSSVDIKLNEQKRTS